jgi:hypothetical protein
LDLYIKDERTSAGQLITNFPAGIALDPFYYAARGYALDADELPVDCHNSPLNRCTERRSKRVAGDSNYSIRNRRKRKTAECSPEERCGWNQIEPPGTRRDEEAVTDEDRARRSTKSAREEEVDAGVIRRAEARNSVAASDDRVVVEFPIESHLLRVRRKVEGREGRVDWRNPGKRLNPRCTSDHNPQCGGDQGKA